MQTAPLVLIFVGIVAAWLFAAMGKGKGLDTFRAETTAQFNVWLASQSASQLGLSPDRCEIVKREETIGGGDGAVDSYTLTLFLRTGTGQYAMFKSTPTGPYVKLVESSVARVVLKDRYVPLEVTVDVRPEAVLRNVSCGARHEPT